MIDKFVNNWKILFYFLHSLKLFSKLGWSGLFNRFKNFIEVCNIIKSGLKSNFKNSKILFHQPPGSIAYTDFIKVIDKCFSCSFLMNLLKVTLLILTSEATLSRVILFSKCLWTKSWITFILSLSSKVSNQYCRKIKVLYLLQQLVH